MSFSRYISHVYPDKQKVSDHQCETKDTFESYAENDAELDRELALFYLNALRPGHGYDFDSALLREFLAFHLRAFKGDPIDFIYMVEDLHVALYASGHSDFKSLWLDNRKLNSFLSDWVGERKLEYREQRRVEREKDTRVKVALSGNDIKAFFMEHWASKNKDGGPFLTEEQVTHFLHANFAAFTPRVEAVKVKSRARYGAHIRRPLHAFYKEYGSGYRTEVFCRMLSDNFKDFEDATLKSLMRNFAD